MRLEQHCKMVIIFLRTKNKHFLRFYVFLSERPKYNEKINAMAALSPSAFLSHTTSPVKILAPLTKLYVSLKRMFFPLGSIQLYSNSYKVYKSCISLIIKCHHFIPSEFWSKMASNSMTIPWTFSIKIPSKWTKIL